MARLFISYRTVDGRDKATALARDLGELYGDQQVFLDKDDLRGGVRWRAAIGQAIADGPVLLLLLTPQLLAATDEDGALRISAADDPVRREVEAALAVGAPIIPLLCDDLPAPPDFASLPPPFDRLDEFSWRQLRAYDWQNDVQRLVDDLCALGVTPPTRHPLVPPAPTSATADSARRRRRRGSLAIATMLAGALLLTAAGGWYATSRPTPATPATPAATAGAAVPPRPADGLAASPAPALGGRWLAELAPAEQVVLSLRQSGDDVTLGSPPVDIRQRPDWRAYRKFWRENSPEELNAIAYRGNGSLHSAADGSTVVGIALEVVSIPGETLIDTGNLRCTLSDAGAVLDCQLWLNSLQSGRPLRLTRQPAAS